ncbi:MAG: HAD hydrolase family protein, partial [Clostridium sp.]
MSNYKVIVMDIDGTLVNEEKKIPKKTKDALMKAQEKGIRLVLASGRAPNSLIHFSKELELYKHHGLLVCYNGSKVIDSTTNEILFHAPLSIAEGKKVLNHIKKFNVTPMIYHNEFLYTDNENGYLVDYECKGGNFTLTTVSDLEEFLNFPPSKILSSGEPEYMKKVYDDMTAPFI